jgi:hypothetical protein
VIESRFELAGYHERYSRLQARQTTGGRSFGKSPRAPYFDLTADHYDFSNLVCSRPEPATSPGPLSVIQVEEIGD